MLIVKGQMTQSHLPLEVQSEERYTLHEVTWAYLIIYITSLM